MQLACLLQPAGMDPTCNKTTPIFQDFNLPPFPRPTSTPSSSRLTQHKQRLVDQRVRQRLEGDEPEAAVRKQPGRQAVEAVVKVEAKGACSVGVCTLLAGGGRT